MPPALADSAARTLHICLGWTAPTQVTILFAGIHLQEEIWGKNVADFRPARWPMPESKSLAKDNTTFQTQNLKIPTLTLQPPVKGAFYPGLVDHVSALE
jgi:hypothetical protein